MIQGGTITVILVLIAAIIEAWYLLKILSVMFSRDKSKNVIPISSSILLLIPVLFIVISGLFPKTVYSYSKRAEQELYNNIAYQEQVLGNGGSIDE